jgi:hypothetical protein
MLLEKSVYERFLPVHIPLGLVAMSFGREAQEAVFVVVLLPWLCLSSSLLERARWRLLRVVISRYGVLEVGDEAVERVVELLEERHAAALVRGRLLRGVLRILR